MGYSLIVLSSIVKLPQIIKLIKNWSTYGIVFFSVCAELTMNMLNVSYGMNK